MCVTKWRYLLITSIMMWTTLVFMILEFKTCKIKRIFYKEKILQDLLTYCLFYYIINIGEAYVFT